MQNNPKIVDLQNCTQMTGDCKHCRKHKNVQRLRKHSKIAESIKIAELTNLQKVENTNR